MLELKNIKKSYKTGDFFQNALSGVSLDFRKNEFVAILGPSGSGKTTLLNIIGGLDQYDSGDLIINGKSTKKFKDIDWDAYRNNSIGFVFQNYNLISHISVLSNVEMGMTLRGISASRRKKKALEVLSRVGLIEHAHKKPNQLSGGQMQRVAIARALSNNPDIILADEPTGALDSKTSVQVMELIKEIAKDKLVIMVTHNAELAKTYANRVIELRDGALLSDSNPIINMEEKEKYNIKKTSMSFLTALNLSFNNIATKKGRTLLTAFAASIGIIGIALILSLSNGFTKQINSFEKDTMSSFPIIISEQPSMVRTRPPTISAAQEYPQVKVVYPYDTAVNTAIHKNIMSEQYISYLEEIDPLWINGIAYARSTGLNLLSSRNGTIRSIKTEAINFVSLPKELNPNENYLAKEYDLLAGTLPVDTTELVLEVDSSNRVQNTLLNELGIDATQKSISFTDVIGTSLKIVLNNDYYKKNGSYYTINNDVNAVYNSKNNLLLKIVGVVRVKKSSVTISDNSGMQASNSVGSILYSNSLMESIISANKTSNIVKSQLNANYNVLTGANLDNNMIDKNALLNYLGAIDIPVSINIYPKDFKSKTNILTYLDAYNKNLSDKDKIIYTDLAATISSLSGNIMDAITIVLVAFSGISLVVSSIMIGIITYISVLERTKEIGILRALGARKKDVTRVFNAETFIIGLCSGMIGILIASLLIIPINIILKNLTTLSNVAQMNPLHALILITVSIILTLIGGFIPAKMASRKDPVEALRTE